LVTLVPFNFNRYDTTRQPIHQHISEYTNDDDGWILLLYLFPGCVAMQPEQADEKIVPARAGTMMIHRGSPGIISRGWSWYPFAFLHGLPEMSRAMSDRPTVCSEAGEHRTVAWQGHWLVATMPATTGAP